MGANIEISAIFFGNGANSGHWQRQQPLSRQQTIPGTKADVRADDSWLSFTCEADCQSYQSFYPPFSAQQHKAFFNSDDSSTSEGSDATPPVQGRPFKARRASWIVDCGEWRPTLSQRPQEQSKERLQGTALIAVQPKTARALCNVSQQGCGVVPATEVAVVAKVVR
eukprot:CAMPEP_0172856684 /NCGR_PEP_ID=MMETSP1075-20121228/64179_1 /TAXON_ID=2916 /ORGANISM="Ceratium fusus, Strain PA161109" /LENGTH=166 /DNA_ID=CAMNT_0013703901 /DNA_START=152 /DNA_END=649 /DNA_ORIENTATION=-